MIHFFTIVLNGRPYLRAQYEVLRRLDVPWRWHIAEGVAALGADTGWSLPNGGRVPEDFHEDFHSIDGTLDDLSDLGRCEERITWHTRPRGRNPDVPWKSKTEMVNYLLEGIHDQGLLWQLDVDEFWTCKQIRAMYQLFADQPDRTAAWFWSRFYVGPDLVITSRNCYANNPMQDWLRVWRFWPGMHFSTHEPPCLVTRDSWAVVGRINPFMHGSTEAAGLVFRHYAYVREEQVAFKEVYYGYRGAVKSWRALQAHNDFPALLQPFMPWADSRAIVDRVKDRCHV
jgi:hypothetical protein